MTAQPQTRSYDDVDLEYMDEFDGYNFGTGFDKLTAAMKEHSKSVHKEWKANLKYAPSGNVRVVVTKLRNSEAKKKRTRLNSV
eukprot:Em0017g178a